MYSPTSLFISHGAPDLVTAGTEASQFLVDYGQKLVKPDGIVMVSAHHETTVPTVVSNPAPEMIYDFRGFGEELQQVIYPAPGSPTLAGAVVKALDIASIPVEIDEKRGFDHGAWVPLKLMLPSADVPVVQLSIQPDKDARWHFEIGQALQPLTEFNILIIGSGSMTHNLAFMFKGGIPARDSESQDWVVSFADWINEALISGDVERLLAYRELAPHAVKNHPEEDHISPLFVAAGAAATKKAGNGRRTHRIHDSTEFGILAMDAYAFS